MAHYDPTLESEEDQMSNITSFVYQKAFEAIDTVWKFPPPPEFMYNPSRIEKDVHPDLFNDGWFHR